MAWELKKWQYLRDEVKSYDAMDDMLAHWGTQGWELVSILTPPGDGKWVLIFKQRLPDSVQ